MENIIAMGYNNCHCALNLGPTTAVPLSRTHIIALSHNSWEQRPVVMGLSKNGCTEVIKHALLENPPLVLGLSHLVCPIDIRTVGSGIS